MTRRSLMKSAGQVSLGLAARSLWPSLALAEQTGNMTTSQRPVAADRKFHSAAVEEFITQTSKRVADPELAMLFANCYPNTLDTTVEPGTFEGKPDTAVITGDIAAMWLRDSSAQVWPYLPFASKDPALRALLEGVIRRQARCILIDPYANAFMADLSAPALEGSRKDKTDMKQGVGERKWELDSLCYPIRLAHGYWKQTGDVKPFDARWRQAVTLIVATMRVQQRKHGEGPYRFQRVSDVATETLPSVGYGNPVKPVGLIASGFRPSDDACIFPFLVPANLFAVTSLRHLAEMAHAILHDEALANDAQTLAAEVEQALRQYAIAPTKAGTIWAYEVDGFGSQLLMDDANVPSLLGLPYIASSPDAALYARTRSFVWSEQNPWFFHGAAGEGIGGPHEGKDMIWPMAQIIYALTSTSDTEIRRSLVMLKASSAGSGFMHESYFKDDPKRFTRTWFAWANTLFGELVGHLAATRPELLHE
ncbi:glycoside hydrolase family 125 protein [Granulicella arctica]|uniref:glycoside hydrolase family 125 protein n=1 Tax=Granulicella arctica TaxID=940613 RepID=UPI0021E050B3|nr:glycoside hydrolase family 125 protein [Granulicella arctica]